MGRDMTDNNAMDYLEHERTYALFVGLAKWGSAIIAIVLALMALLLV
jgi:hypothetical protein